MGAALPDDKWSSLKTALEILKSVVCDSLSITEVEQLATELGVSRLRWQELSPRNSNRRMRTFSDKYGLDAFPWHTDGAVATSPPKFVILRALECSDDTEPTELLNLTVPELAPVAHALARVVLRATDKTGRVRYLPASTQLQSSVCFRWDPIHCPPVTMRGVPEAAQLIEKSEPTDTVSWKVGTTAIFDNRAVLHRRPRIYTTNKRLIARLYVY
jgi:hypothetical protein